jgi:hypothetical protein
MTARKKNLLFGKKSSKKLLILRRALRLARRAGSKFNQ